MTYLLVCALVDRIVYDIFVECVIMEFMVLLVLVMGLCKEKFQKSEITMEVGGWGGSRSHSQFFFLWKIIPK